TPANAASPARSTSHAPTRQAAAAIGDPLLDPPTQTSIGLQLPLTGDVSYGATASVRYRQSGTSPWREGLPLLRVRPETVHRPGGGPPEQFAGSVVDLRPATSYDVEVHVTGGGLDVTKSAAVTTKAVPGDPSPATPVDVYDAPHLSQALQQARAGSVLLLHEGTYPGPFQLINYRPGDQPIVIRGVDREKVVLDGGGTAGPVLDVYGGRIHVENLTLQNGERGVRFLGGAYNGVTYPAVENVVRGVHVKNTNSGITTDDSQTGYNGDYLCDNVLEGRTARGRHWVDATPANPNPDNSPANYQGVMVGGGSTVCHNTISGFGDALHVTGQQSGHATRAVDFYGNDIRWTFDNGVEADGSEGNIRIYRNRFLNTYMPLSFQPVFGGPVYAFRNVIVNAYSEPLKFHGDAGTLDNSNGVLVLNNTVVKAGVPLSLNTTTISANFRIENNLFIGNGGQQSVAWAPQSTLATFDHDAYYPAGTFSFGGTTYPDLHAAQQAGYEPSGRTVGPDVFASLAPWPSWDTYAEPSVDAGLAPNSAARDQALALPGINDVPDGHPDLGALEYGCAAPVYGIRPSGVDENTEASQCGGSGPVSWTSLVNATATGGTLRKSGGSANAQDSGALSAQPASGVEFGWPEASASGCVGLGAQDPSTACSMTYRLVLQPHDGQQLATAYGPEGYVADTYYQPGDRLRIAITAGAVTFARVTNGSAAVFGTSTTPPSPPLWIDASLWDPTSTAADTQPL
ncbi:MAG: hypothetical protein QOI35_3967, partial [Cryptosporangiaceae bacterium]|nr:hypothetical protein [Cryptosporangiaceae bacterium]